MYVDLTRLKWYVSQPSQDSIRFLNFLWGSIRLTATVGTVCFLYVVSYIVTRPSNPYSHDSLYFLVRVSQIWKICTGVTCVKHAVIYGPHYIIRIRDSNASNVLLWFSVYKPHDGHRRPHPIIGNRFRSGIHLDAPTRWCVLIFWK